MINRGYTRMRLTHVRPDSGAAQQGGTCRALMPRRSFASEGTFGVAEPEGCASMCAQPIRVIRGYEMSRLQRLDRLRVEKEVEKADMADAVVVDVLDGHRGAVDHHLAEVVARMLQGEGFLGHLLRVRNHPCRLDVYALVAAIDGLLHSTFDFMGLYKKRRVVLCQNVITEIRRQDCFFLYLSSKKRARGFGSDGKKAFKEAA